jgi:hypothetical protein
MSGNRRTQNDVGVYVRKSSNKQSDLSLPAQERIIRQRILEPAGVSDCRSSGYTAHRSSAIGYRASSAILHNPFIVGNPAHLPWSSCDPSCTLPAASIRL